MRESEVMGNYHASFGERDRETRMVQAMKVHPVPTPFSSTLMNFTLNGMETMLKERFSKSERAPDSVCG